MYCTVFVYMVLVLVVVFILLRSTVYPKGRVLYTASRLLYLKR